MLVKNRKHKRRLNPVYWAIQFLGGMFALASLFFRANVEKQACTG